MGRYSRTLLDYDNESTTIGVYAADLNAGNIATQITLQADFGAAINDMALGTLQRIQYGNTVESLQPPPSDPFAQRELKWRVDYRDTVNGKPGFFTIGTANAALLSATDRGKADPLNADVIAFTTAAEAYVLSQDGNAIEIEQIVIVGRNV